MVGRILARLAVALRGQLRLLVIFTVVLVVGITYTVVMQPKSLLNTQDCAEVVMTNLDGPASDVQDQATWDCLSTTMQKQIGTEAALKASNQQFPTGIKHTRVGQSQPHADGTSYIFYDSAMGQRYAFYIITVDSSGKVTNIQ